ncbi:MAG: CBS domain-containing protein [Leptospiraceae bacterium]|nr:CBS domain-containing protein [Leptospiraceae bacterium]
MSYSIIPTELLESGVSYHRPTPTAPLRVSMDSSAMEVMTDLKQVAASTIGPESSVEEANTKMKLRGVRMLLVVDVDDTILGLITATDVLGEKPMQYLNTHGGQHKDIKVKNIMTPQSQIEVLLIRDVSQASVGDVVETLKKVGHQHAVVVDNQGPNNARTIRGIFSLNQIARQLGINIVNYEVPHTLSEIANYRSKDK